MSAKCGECGEPVSSKPYEDEKELSDECGGYCGQPLCVDCAMREGGICQDCKKGLAEP